MHDQKHVLKIPIESIEENVIAEPRIPCSEEEVQEVLQDLYLAVDNKTYIPAVSTEENPALSDYYVFNIDDEHEVLKDLRIENLVGKVKDLSKGAKKRRERGLPQEYLYVFKYACRLMKKEMDDTSSEPMLENVLIYIKINDRKIPEEKVIVVSFHKNNSKE